MGLTSVSEQSFPDFIQKRALPGLLVVEPAGRIVFASDEAQQFLDEIAQGATQNGTSRGHTTLPHLIVEFCREVTRQLLLNGTAKESPPRRAMLFHGPCGDFIIIAVFVSRPGLTARRKLVFLVVQKIGQRKGFDIELLGRNYDLTKREQEVVTRLVQGDSNKEIAASLNIQEYTVKDHLKHIMAKCQVGSRVSILSKMLSL